MFQPLHDLELPEDVPDFIPLDALLLVHVLHRVHFLSVPLLHDADLSDSQKGEHSGQHFKGTKRQPLTASPLLGSSLGSEILLVEQRSLCHNLSNICKMLELDQIHLLIRYLHQVSAEKAAAETAGGRGSPALKELIARGENRQMHQYLRR